MNRQAAGGAGTKQRVRVGVRAREEHMNAKVSSFFPFHSVREGQREFMADVEHALVAGEILLAHAPTGIGKTVAALAPAIQYAIENEKTVFFLTPKRSQHKIAIDTLRLIKEHGGLDLTVVDITSKQSMCPRAVSLYREFYSLFNEFCRNEQRSRRCWYYMNHDADAMLRIRSEIMHVEELCEWCRERQICPYKTALEVGKDADAIVCDYNYLFSRDIAEKVLEKIGRSLDELILIVDEAHNLPDRIRRNLSSELRLKTISEAARGIRSIDREMYHNLSQLEMTLSKLVMSAVESRREEMMVDRDFLMGELEKILRQRIEVMSYEEFSDRIRSIADTLAGAGAGAGAGIEADGIGLLRSTPGTKERETLQRNLISIADFLDAWRTEDKCLRILSLRAVDNPTLSVKLLDPSVLSEPVFRKAHASIIMSGTLYPVEMYADVLGISRIETRGVKLRKYRSPFPRENRLIVVTRGLTTRYTERNEAMYMRIGEEIGEVAENVRGCMAVFFPSYALLKSILAYLPPRIRMRVRVERREMGKADRNRLYEQLRNDDAGILFAVQGGSFSEGMDYESNILKTIIVVGLPLSPPTLEVKMIQGYYAGKYGTNTGRLYGYLYPAITKVLQAAGRGIRSEHDRCIIILMDYRFAQFPYKRCLPPDFDMIFTDKEKVADLCRQFFNSAPSHLRSG